MSIETVTIRGGAAPWAQAVIEWSGDSVNWRLVNTTTQEVLYYGGAMRYDMATVPEAIYHLDLIDDFGNHQPFAYVAPPLSAPSNLQAINITTTAATLTWTAMTGVTSYEVKVDDQPTTVPAPTPPAEPSLALSGLESDRSYSMQVRAHLDAADSLWSPLDYFTTNSPAITESTSYEYEPMTARTWNSSGWMPDDTDLLHGDGIQFGDSRGINTTVFVYSADTLRQIRQLAGMHINSVEVALTRTITRADARMVLSHWLLHNLTEIPAGAPTFVAPAMGVDSGSLALGQQSWMALPIGWAEAIINNTAAGIGWGAVKGRYQIAPPLISGILPVTGTLRVTVG